MHAPSEKLNLSQIMRKHDLASSTLFEALDKLTGKPTCRGEDHTTRISGLPGEEQGAV